MAKKTYPRHRTHPAIMGCGGKNKPTRVIDGDRVMFYVGIGWVDEGKATAADKKKYPKLTG
jgi:hypothetical protein